MPGVPGRDVVTPDNTAVITANPDGAHPSEQALLTITTCHPRFSAHQRLIIHAVLTERTERTTTR